MKNRLGKAGKHKNAAKALIFGGASALCLALLVLLTLYLTRPRLLWYVDEDFSASWHRILRESPPPFSRFEIIPRTDNAPFPQGRFGFTVSRSGPRGEHIEGAPVVLYRELARTRQYHDWFALALDPWMVFRKHHDPEPQRSFLDNANERGSILLAGLDQNAVQAWVSQLLQQQPGVFVQGNEVWQEKSASLVRDYPFQSGAFSFSWVQVWPLLFRTGTVWLYAPLSQARALPPYRAGLLDATRFPEPPGWDRFGLQADILWANVHGSPRQRERIAATERWLRDARTQTAIANAIQWIPAHPSGTPFNTVSWVSQMAWLRSSYIWQRADNAQDS
jgi:hypothetical protein